MSTKLKGQSLGAKIKGYVRKLDQYGYRVHINYDGDETFKTFFGGTMSIISRILIVVYFGFVLNAVINRQRSNITQMY